MFQCLFRMKMGFFLFCLVPLQVFGSEVYISALSSTWVEKQGKTGDIDSIVHLTRGINEFGKKDGIKATFLDRDLKTSENVVQWMRTKRPSIFHLFLNYPITGSAIDVKSLEQIKEMGHKVVISYIESRRVTNGRFKVDLAVDELISRALYSDSLIFFDEEDRDFLSKHCSHSKYCTRTLEERMRSSDVIPVMSIRFNRNSLPSQNSEHHVLSFGMIRPGKGFAHIVKFAQLLKRSKINQFGPMKMIVAGSFLEDFTVNDSDADELRRLLKAMYPFKEKEIDETRSRRGLLNKHKELSLLEPVIPMELHLNLEEEQLQELFLRCRYGIYSAYRGASIRNSSLNTLIQSGLVVFSLQGEITPRDLLIGGRYEEAINIVDDSSYSKFADQILESIEKRESPGNETMNQRTLEKSRKLTDEQLSSQSISERYIDVYKKVLSK